MAAVARPCEAVPPEAASRSPSSRAGSAESSGSVGRARLFCVAIGNERSIKRLSLAQVSHLDLEPGPVVDRSATADQIRAALEVSDLDWVGVTEDGRLVGWAPAADLDLAAVAPLAGVELREVVARLEPTASLRAALELILTARTSIALVADPGGTYLGAVTLETIRAGLSA